MHLTLSPRAKIVRPFEDVFSGSVHEEDADVDELSTADDTLDIATAQAAGLHVDLIPTTTWEGYVTHVGTDGFEAELHDKQRLLAPLSVDIEFDSVLREDHPLVKEGAVFYWIIGRAVCSGQHFNFDDIRFRRLPNWTEERVARATAEADDMFDFLQTTPLTK